mgnify:CR=1 FL=1
MGPYNPRFVSISQYYCTRVLYIVIQEMAKLLWFIRYFYSEGAGGWSPSHIIILYYSIYNVRDEIVGVSDNLDSRIYRPESFFLPRATRSRR